MNGPTLLVGVGGAGCKIITRVAKLADEKELEKIAFVALDTDINELRDIEKANPFVKVIQTSTKQTVGEYLDRDTHARDTWFPVNPILNTKTLTEGAGQVRAVSRLALETVIRAGKMEPLHEAIQSLYKVEEEKAEQALKIVIVGSLAGGTGSGLVLPLAMYIKNYLAQKFRYNSNITRGFFLLPEIFDGVISTPAEKNNLKANAYAALREIDAFLMKGDNMLHERYHDSVRMHFPRAGSDGYEEYDVRPYDYCFLFDAQNVNGGKLNSHDQYLQHAATCIYSQTISSMNKRSNSSEDNTIRALARARGRNRYAGAGASLLLYPFEDVKKYIALQWARDSVSKQWLVFDNEYKAFCEDNARQEADGFVSMQKELSEYYVNVIKEKAKNEDAFSNAIVNACTIFENDGFTPKTTRWNKYVGSLIKKIEENADKLPAALTTTKEDISTAIGKLSESADWEKYVKLYRLVDTYRKQVRQHVNENARIMAYTLFKADRTFKSKEPQEFELEYYLRDSKNHFMHPNAVRYFLKEAYDLMKKKKASAESDIDGFKEDYDSIETVIFDDPATEDRQENADSAAGRKTPFINERFNKPTDEQDSARETICNYYSAIDEYMKASMRSTVLEEGCKYIESLLKSFEMFYKTFESKVSSIDKEISEISKKYVSQPGSTVRYVCADEACLKAIYKNKKYYGNPITIDSELAQDIYYKVLEYAMMPEKPGNNQYFSKLFDEGIVGYFEKSVMQIYGSDIDVDIITALEQEAVLLNPEYKEKANASQLIDIYVEEVIKNTRELSCPFIEAPSGGAADAVINACAFNREMYEEAEKKNPKRLNFINSTLKNFGGSLDEDVPKNKIMFYQSIYALRANDLSKFAPPKGDYFKAYYELIEGIHPETSLSREISPHIDRWWHIITKTPDIDEGNQLKQEQEINAAFFWSILCKYIDRFEEVKDRFVYKLDKEDLEMDSDILLVSNGTQCDKLYEVLDAIAIYPELTRKILDRVNLKSKDDINKSRPLEKGLLMRGINNLAVSEPGLNDGKNIKPATSIFTIPLMMKKSTNTDMYYEDTVLQILKTEIEEVKKYLSLYYTDKELIKVMGEILTEQFNKYLADIAYESKGNKDIYKSSLFASTISIIAKAFEKLDLEDEARNVKDTANALKKD